MKWYDGVTNVVAFAIGVIGYFIGGDTALFLSAFGCGMISATFLAAALRRLEK